MLHFKKIFKLLCLQHGLNFITTLRYPKTIRIEWTENLIKLSIQTIDSNNE